MKEGVGEYFTCTTGPDRAMYVQLEYFDAKFNALLSQYIHAFFKLGFGVLVFGVWVFDVEFLLVFSSWSWSRRRKTRGEGRNQRNVEAEFDIDVCLRGSVAFTVWMRKGL